jgi:signal transduction histidine kinase
MENRFPNAGDFFTKYGDADGRPEEILEEFACMAAAICRAPHALITLIDERRTWRHARAGEPLSESKEGSLQRHAILQSGLFELDDVRRDRRFAEHPLFISNPEIKFYLTLPLVTGHWHTLGSLCVWGERPQKLDDDQREALQALARRLARQLEQNRREEELLHLQAQSLADEGPQGLEASLQKALRRICHFAGWAMGQAWLVKPDGSGLKCGPVWTHTFRVLDELRRASQELTFREGQGLPGRVWASRRLFWTEDLSLLEKSRKDAAESCGIEACMAFPMMAGGDLWAVLEFFQFGPVRKDPALLDSVAAVAAQLGSSLKRRQLESQVRQMQKMDAVGKLAGGLAHDFNNLLTVILAHSEILSEKVAGREEWSKGLREIHRAGERGAALVRQLLAISRKQEVMPQVLDLNDLVREMEEMLKRLFGRKIHLVSRLSGRPCRVLADRIQMEQVLLNLAVNARDAMPEGGEICLETGAAGEISGLAVRQGAPGLYVKISVRDTGVGMTEEVKSRLFEPFFTTKEKGKGTGLGLSMVYGIVKHSGGFVNVDSHPGQGSTFHVYLPVASKLEGKAGTAFSEKLESNRKGGEEMLRLGQSNVLTSPH